MRSSQGSGEGDGVEPLAIETVRAIWNQLITLDFSMRRPGRLPREQLSPERSADRVAKVSERCGGR